MLFQAIPDTFFSILASPNKKLYWECIFKLFTITSTQLSFGMNRDDAADELAYYLESDLSIEFQEENDESLENIKASGSASRERAETEIKYRLDELQTLRNLRGRLKKLQEDLREVSASETLLLKQQQYQQVNGEIKRLEKRHRGPHSGKGETESFRRR